jgi:two-component system, NtrC family, response regulator AtoC
MPAVLIEGETGTGKGLLARVLHAHSARSDGPFIDINCAAIPPNLLEAELFGFERGAFTDARQAKPGLCEAAHQGTCFLDEIGLLAGDVQAKVLTVIESGVVRRVGSTRSRPIDVWIISASNEDLTAAVAERRFREDLYHRLAVLTVALPPLRERGRDVLILAEYLLGRLCDRYDLPLKALTRETCDVLMSHGWPGNIRELGNTIERAVLLAPGPLITPDLLRLHDVHVRSEADMAEPPVTPLDCDRAEQRLLKQTLDETDWNFSRAAARLGISRNTLRHRVAKYGLTPRMSPLLRRSTRHELRRTLAWTAPRSPASAVRDGSSPPDRQRLDAPEKRAMPAERPGDQRQARKVAE